MTPSANWGKPYAAMSLTSAFPLLKTFRFQAVTSALLLGLVASPIDAAPLIGPLEQQVLDIYRLGGDLDPCELQPNQKALRLGIARALDLREMELEEYLRASARSNRNIHAEGLKAGPLSLIPRSETAKPNGDRKGLADGWISFTIGWDDFEKEYQAIRNSRPSVRWVRLLGYVRATLADDYRRAVRGNWYGLSVEGVAEANILANLLSECVSEKKCDALEKSDSFVNALYLSRNASGLYATFKRAANGDERSRAARNIYAAMKPFLTYFEPLKQRGPRFDDSNTLIVPLDAGDFRGYETDLAILIERFWQIASGRMRVEWISSYRTDLIFKFLFTSTPKAASQIDYSRRTITLAQGAGESMPAHLVGRALGFRPRFFSIWRPTTCKYEDQSKPDDLMSDGRTGTVNSAHWTSLKKTYAEKP